MSKNKKITIHDLAEELGYSASTISRALSDSKHISKKTKKIIAKAAKLRGYRPNTVAAGLRKKKSNTIGILISRINRPFISSLISGIEEEARSAGYNVLMSQSNDSYENEVNNAKAMYENAVSGLVVSLSMETMEVSHFQEFIDQGIPIAFVDRVPTTLNSYKVVIDNFTSGFLATKHLLEQGCRRIAHFAGAQHRNVYKERKRGYLKALEEFDIAADTSLIIYFNTLSFEEGGEATSSLLSLKNPPDGIFSANDTAAASAIICARKKGVKVPEELAVIGFNDDPIAAIVDPPLSTVTHPAYKMGKIAANRVLNHNTETYESESSQVTILNTEIIVRASSSRKV